MVVASDALSGDGQARRARLARTTNATPAGVAGSLRAAAAAESVTTTSTTAACQEVEPGENGTRALDIDRSSYAMLRHGGAVTVAAGGSPAASRWPLTASGSSMLRGIALKQ